MVSLKELHEHLVLEEINENYFLYNLNEALNRQNIQKVSEAIANLKQLVDKTGLTTLKSAFDAADKDARSVSRIRNQKKAAEKAIKVITFHGKVSNFLGKDLPLLKGDPNFTDFFDEKTPKDATLASQKNFKEIREVFKNAVAVDSSPWYKKALSALSGEVSWIAGVPYLNIDKLIDELMGKSKEELEKIISNISPNVVKQGSARNLLTAITSPARAQTGAGASIKNTNTTTQAQTGTQSRTATSTTLSTGSPVQTGKEAQTQGRRLDFNPRDINTSMPAGEQAQGRRTSDPTKKDSGTRTQMLGSPTTTATPAPAPTATTKESGVDKIRTRTRTVKESHVLRNKQFITKFLNKG
jgi:hypothetical protein